MSTKDTGRFPECVICKKTFTWTGPKAYRLSCFHPICQECIQSGTGDMYCPTCKKDTMKGCLQEDTVREREILQLTLEHSPGDIVCTNDDDGDQAVCWCKECQLFLCEHCQNNHQSLKSVTEHVLIPTRNLKVKDEHVYRHCGRHGSLIKLYCKDCSVLVCHECKQDGHGGHSIVGLEQACMSARERTEQLLKEAADFNEITLSLLTETEIQTKVLEETAESLEQMVDNTFSSLKAVINQRKEDVEKKLGVAVKNDQKYNDERKVYLKLTRTRCDASQGYIQKALKYLQPLELLDFVTKEQEHFREVFTSEKHVSTKRVPSFNFSTSGFDNVRDKVLQFGQVITVENGQSAGEVHSSDREEHQKIPVSAKSEGIPWFRMAISIAIGVVLFGILIEYARIYTENAKLTEDLRSSETMKDEYKRMLSNLGVPDRVTPHLLQTEWTSIILHCPQLSLSRRHSELHKRYINSGNEMISQPRKDSELNRSVAFLDMFTDDPLTGNNFPQYFEIEGRVEYYKDKQTDKNFYLYEIGLCSGNVSFGDCCTVVIVHDKNFTRPWLKDNDRTLYTFINGSDFKYMLFGVLYDKVGGRIEFFSDRIGKGGFGACAYIPTKQVVWPLLRVYNSKYASTKLKLISGNQISMDNRKKREVLHSFLRKDY